jgi:hypothetical protein
MIVIYMPAAMAKLAHILQSDNKIMFRKSSSITGRKVSGTSSYTMYMRRNVTYYTHIDKTTHKHRTPIIFLCHLSVG